MRHLDAIIPSTQHGFRKERSTVTNLLHITDFIHNEFTKSNQVDDIYFDFTRAFDTLQHSILAEKLAKYSTLFFIYNAVMQFVINRNYILKVNGIPTALQFITQTAVPQGSLCGPVLFTLMAADIALITHDTNVYQLGYADDKHFFAVVNNFAEQLKLQQCIDKLHQWSIVNGINLNGQKTIHTSHAKRGRLNFNSRYFIEANEIPLKLVVNDLGVHFDSGLTFKHQI